MARLFTSGAEAGTTGVFSVATGISVSTTQKRTGAYSFYYATADANRNGQVNLPASKTELYIRLGLWSQQFYGGGSQRGVILRVKDSANGLQGTLVVNVGTLRLGWCVGDGSSPGPVAEGGLIVLSAWTGIEVWFKPLNSGGRVIVKQDGAIVIDYTGDTQLTANANVQYVQYGTDYYGSSGYQDDLAINDTAGAVNNSWIGRGGIYVKVMTGVGTYTDLVASAGNPWDCIEEVPPNDADYVYESTVNKKSTYAGSVLTPTTGTIACINVIMRAKLDAAGTGNIARLIRSNAVDSQGSDVGLDTSPKTIQENIETDPGAAPGTAWTIARVNALEAGAVVR